MSKKIGIVLGISILCYALGYYASPEKVKTEVRTIEVEKKQTETNTDTDRNKHKETTTTEVIKPDGTKETTTKVVEDSTTNRQSQTKEKDTSKRSETDTKEVTKSHSRLSLAALGGIPLSFTGPVTPVYGASISKEVLGPISIGLWGLSSREVGASIGLSF